MFERKELERDLGLEKLQELMNPGEVFVSNAPDESVAMTSEWNAQKLVKDLIKTGKYESIRIIDKAYDRKGEEMLGYRAVVARPVQD